MTTQTTKSKTTKTSKTTTKQKSTAPKRSIKDFAPKPKTPASVEATAKTAEENAPPELRKRELVDRVVEKTGLQKSKVKPAVEAAIAVLGEAIMEGRDVTLPPLGKIKLKKTRDAGRAQVTVAKIRQSKPDAV